VAPQKQDVPIMYNTCSTHSKVSHVLLHGRRHDILVDLATFETHFLIRLLLLLILFLSQLHMKMMMIMMVMMMLIIITIIIIQNHP